MSINKSERVKNRPLMVINRSELVIVGPKYEASEVMRQGLQMVIMLASIVRRAQTGLRLAPTARKELADRVLARRPMEGCRR